MHATVNIFLSVIDDLMRELLIQPDVWSPLIRVNRGSELESPFRIGKIYNGFLKGFRGFGFVFHTTYLPYLVTMCIRHTLK